MKQTNVMGIDSNLNKDASKFRKNLLNPFLQRIFLLAKLPAAFFMSVRVKSLTNQDASVTVPYCWRSQNPFKSTYFAAQAAAAEMSTGVLAMLHIQGKGKISMLITNMEGTYGKKATSLTTFNCVEGQKVIDTVEQALKNENGASVTLETIGTQINKDGIAEEVSRFKFTWSFRLKK